jgi:hypothetical protein
MNKWIYHIEIADIWKKTKTDEISVYEFVELFLKRLKLKSFYKKFIKEQDLELEDIILDFELFVEQKNDDKEEFDDIWDRFYDWADGIRLWVNIFK